MVISPVIKTRRLILRRFTLQDSLPLQKYADNQEISRILPNIPYPYTLNIAENWISKQDEKTNKISLAITGRESGEVMGCIEVICDKNNSSASLGYWLGVPFWNQGFCTEATHAVIDFGFEQMGFHRIWAEYWSANPASGRVMEKCSMRKETVMIEKELCSGEYRNIVQYAILRREWEEKKA